MKNISIICINYNSDKDTLSYLASLEKAYCRVVDNLCLTVILIDNSTEKNTINFENKLNEFSFKVVYIKNINNGYFGAAQVGLNYIKKYQILSDFTIVSNVDLGINEYFFNILISKKYAQEIGVVAPSIISNYRQADLNPKIIKKVPKAKFLIFKTIFSNDLLFRIQNKINTYKYRKKRILDKSVYHMKNIYAPHGAFIIFTKEYFDRGGSFDYPIFLFGEEIFVAESCLQLSLHVVYDQELKILDNDHGSTGKEKLTFLRNEYKKALNYVLKNYY